MKIKALISFSGPDVNMAVGEVQEIEDTLAEELVNSGLAESLDEKPAKKPRSKKAEADED